MSALPPKADIRVGLGYRSFATLANAPRFIGAGNTSVKLSIIFMWSLGGWGRGRWDRCLYSV